MSQPPGNGAPGSQTPSAGYTAPGAPTGGGMNLPRRLSRSTTLALILSPTGLLFIAVTRLLIISDYNPATASMIVSNGGYVNTLLGTVIPLIPILMPYLGLVLLFFKRVIPGMLTLLAASLISPTATSESLRKIVLHDWHVAFAWYNTHKVIAGLTGLLATALIMAAISFGFNEFTKTVGTVVSLALIPSVMQLYPLHKNSFGVEQLRQPWLPAETITFTSHQEIIGYVLSSSSDWLVVLMENNRKIVYYHASEVTSQQVCQIEHTGPMKPLVTLIPTATIRNAMVPQCGQSGPRLSSGSPAHSRHGSALVQSDCPPNLPAGRMYQAMLPSCRWLASASGRLTG